MPSTQEQASEQANECRSRSQPQPRSFACCSATLHNASHAHTHIISARVCVGVRVSRSNSMNRVKPRLRSRSWDHHERVVPWLGLLLLLLISTTTTSSNTALPPPSFEGLNTVPVTLSERDFGIAAMGVANQLYNEYDREFELVDLTRLEMHVCSSIVPSIHLSIAHTHHTLAGTSECQVLHSYGKASQAPSSLVWSIRAIVCRSIHGRVRDATLSLAIASHLEHAIQPCYRSMDSKCRSDSDATSRHGMSCRVGRHDA